MVVPSTVCFLLVQDCFGHRQSLCFHRQFKITFFMSVKNDPGTLVGITLDLMVALGRMAISTTTILLLYEHGRASRLPHSLQRLKVSTAEVFRFLASVYLQIADVFYCGHCECDCPLDFFFSMFVCGL